MLFSVAYAELLSRFDLEDLAIDPDEIFPRSRDTDGGRDAAWENDDFRRFDDLTVVSWHDG
jgi:hypothetical protein